MDLFSEQRKQNLQAAAPLAVRMRPRTLEEFLGQQSFVGEGKLLRRMLEADRLSSALFYGPPGTGKTTLAHLIAFHTKAHFAELNAAGSGVKEVREALADARARLEDGGQRSVLFVDELHRFNRAQQDVLLNDVENGVIILIGASTENPFFTVNSPLISRSTIFQFEPLSLDDLKTLMQRALSDPERGLGRFAAALTDEAADHLAKTSEGDARRALTALEIAVLSQAERARGGPVQVDLDVAAESIQRKAVRYDAAGDQHYDTISAYIKSIRASDPDAAVYWLARMLEGGEDPRFIARRMVIAAAEDVGNADPQALVVAQAAADATHFIGLPECELPLAQATLYLACAPKSNASANAVWEARRDVRENESVLVPRHLRSTGYGGAKRLGVGEAYKYPHEYEGGIVAGDDLGVSRTYYRPTDRGYEQRLREALQHIRSIKEGAEPGPPPAHEGETA